MNTIKSCIPCVCTSSGCRRVCEEHNIGTQCEATTTNTATETVEHFGAKSIQKKSAKSSKHSDKTEKSAKSAKIHKTAGGSS